MTATAIEPTTADPYCLGCNYSLRGLASDRCPECGRAFDLDDYRTFLPGRRLTWVEWFLTAPPGWVLIPLAIYGVLAVWEATSLMQRYGMPERFVNGVYAVLAVVLICVLRFVLLVLMCHRLGMQRLWHVWSRTWRRWTSTAAIIVLGLLLAMTPVPTWLRFQISRPFLDAYVEQLRTQPPTPGVIPAMPRYIGLYPVSFVSVRGDVVQVTLDVGGTDAVLCNSPSAPAIPPFMRWIDHELTVDKHLGGGWYLLFPDY
jgi:hypothetical protein